MSLKDILTPKNVEEVRPGLFVQKKGEDYRVVNPIAWKGEWRIKKQFGFKNLFFIALVIFIAWSYAHDTKLCKDLQENPCELLPNLTNYCYEQSSLTNNILEVDNEKRENLSSIQSYS